MDFMPLIEGFLAFALTMAALTSAVSALVGTFQRLARSRARALRQRVEYLFRNDLVAIIRRRPKDEQKKLGTIENARGLFVAEMTHVPEVAPTAGGAEDKAGDGAAKADARAKATAAPTGGPEDKAGDGAANVDGRAKVMAAPTGGAGDSADDDAAELDARAHAMADLESSASMLARWSALRLSVDKLDDDAFANRFAASTLGGWLATHLDADANVDVNFHDLLPIMTQRFAALTVSSKEYFTRRARVWSVLASFAIAFGLNVNSFHLLNSYLSDPDLRANVIAENEARPGEFPSGAPVSSALSVELKAQIAKVQALQAQVAAVVGTLNVVKEATDGTKLAELQALQSGIAKATELGQQFNAIATETQAFAMELDSSIEETRAMLGALGDGFPIGWKYYPNCYKGSTDTRCNAELEADGLAASLENVWTKDRAGFAQWFLGVILTAMMLGLGTPFWVDMATNMARLRAAPSGAANLALPEDALTKVAKAGDTTKP